jgi:hypothetical protein
MKYIFLTVAFTLATIASANADTTCAVNAPDGELNVREVTSNGPGRVIDTLKNGYTVTIRDFYWLNGKSWARVLDGKTKTRVVGWMFKDYLDCGGTRAATPTPTLAEAPQSYPVTGGNGTYETGNDWLKLCEGKPNTGIYINRCYSYTRGLADGLIVWATIDPEGAGICIPGEVTSQQLMEIGVNFIANNPKDRHNGSVYLLALAFRTAYPCERKAIGKPS